jgi:hypothetical protein
MLFNSYRKQHKVYPDAAWALAGLTVSNEDDVRAVATSISNGSCLAISDGCFKDQHGTASWTVQGENSFGALGSSLNTPGNPDDLSAYKSELAGVSPWIAISKSVLSCTTFSAQYWDKNKHSSR